MSDGVIGFNSSEPTEVQTDGETDGTTVSSIGLYPFEIQYENRNGSPVIIKSFKIPAAYDPATLIEEDFKEDNYIYSKKDVLMSEAEIKTETKTVSYPKFTTDYGISVSFKKGVRDDVARTYDSDRLKVINLPVLKRHSIYHVTGAVKSYMGVVANRLTGHRPHNSVRNGGMGTLMAETRAPVLNIMDMVWIGTGNGPGIRYDTATQANMLAAATDPVALDYWAAKYVLLPETDTPDVDPDDATTGSFGHWLRLSAAELQKAGLPAAVEEDDMLLID